MRNESNGQALAGFLAMLCALVAPALSVASLPAGLISLGSAAILLIVSHCTMHPR
jgi:hypothetical protein